MRANILARTVIANTILSILTAAAQQPIPLIAGMNQEHLLSAGEEHVYTITLQEGEAVVGEADQHGIDLVIDEFGTEGKLMRTVDSPNGSEGPEPIDLTASAMGEYKLVLHSLDPKTKPGKYVMKIDRVLTPAENGNRVAEKNYPPALHTLWSAYQNDPKALDDFVASRKGKGPIIDEIKDDSNNVNVTYLYFGDNDTEAVEVFGSMRAGSGGTRMQRFLHSPLFFATESVPKDARFSYGFTKTETRFAGPQKNIQLSDDFNIADPLNPESFNGISVLSLPGAPPQSYISPSDLVPHGRLTPSTFKSKVLHEDRGINIYTPPGYDGSKAADLLIVFDGETYDGTAASLVPTPTILDNLIAAKKIGITMGVFVNNIGQRNRDLGGYIPFSDFVATELIPWIRSKYKIGDGPKYVVLAGSSRGGVAAAHCALLHSDVVGNVLSQSGAFFVRNGNDTLPWPLTPDTGDIVLAYRESPRLPIRFYMEVGRFDSSGGILGNNRELRDVLLVKGYPVTYHEFDGGHDYLSWRGSFADGLIALLGAGHN